MYSIVAALVVSRTTYWVLCSAVVHHAQLSTRCTQHRTPTLTYPLFSDLRKFDPESVDSNYSRNKKFDNGLLCLLMALSEMALPLGVGNRDMLLFAVSVQWQLQKYLGGLDAAAEFTVKLYTDGELYKRICSGRYAQDSTCTWEQTWHANGVLTSYCGSGDYQMAKSAELFVSDESLCVLVSDLVAVHEELMIAVNPDWKTQPLLIECIKMSRHASRALSVPCLNQFLTSIPDSSVSECDKMMDALVGNTWKILNDGCLYWIPRYSILDTCWRKYYIDTAVKFLQLLIAGAMPQMSGGSPSH